MTVNHRYGMTDYKRNNRIAIRNFKNACDFHDIVKLMLVRMLRRKNPNNKVPIYTEYNATEPMENFPDIQMFIKGYSYVWEIQERVTKEWKRKILKQHEQSTVIIVPLQEIYSKLEDRMMNNLVVNKHFNLTEDLNFVLSDYVI